MTPHRIYNIAGELAIVAMFAAIQQMDAVSEHTAAMQVANDKAAARLQAVADRREWQSRVSVCHRAFGPQTQPGEDADGNFICTDARGRSVAMK